MGANQPNASYRLLQKEREALRFPFSITAEGLVLLNEELDREEKDMVSRVTTHSHTARTHRTHTPPPILTSYCIC